LLYEIGGIKINKKKKMKKSLLTSFSKVIEKLIYVRLLDHINANCILVNEQNGFRSQSSTEQATFSLVNNVLTAMGARGGAVG
jgi:hypothetical protein